MKVLLTAINAKYIHSNLAVYSLRAYAGKYAQQTEIAEYTINQTMDDILSDIYRKKPDILCLSCYLWNILYVEQLITEIHKVLPKMQIWLGGPEVSYNAVSVMEQYPQVTGVMCGEGEETFLELMEYWNQERESLDTIKGIVYRENGTCRQNPPRPVMDLSKVPFVYDHIEDFQNKIIYYESSRGCPFSCTLFTIRFTSSKFIFLRISVIVSGLVDWIPISSWISPGRMDAISSISSSFNRSAATSKWKFVFPLSCSFKYVQIAME